jgi:glycosyltransferase involved in cell wall biosynthesis
MKTISIVIPVYYNELSLHSLFKSLALLETALKKKAVEIELIFVDDGSGDKSFSELLKIKAERPMTKIIKHSRNFGSIRAIKTGFRFVSGDCFTFLAADLQDPPELIDQMVDQWLAGAKYVTCVRRQREDPLTSRMFSYIYYKLVHWFVVRDFPEGGYDLALMDRIMLPYLLQSGKNINISLFAHSLGFTAKVIYYDRQRRQHGKSRWTFAKKFNYFVDSLVGFSFIPLRLVSWMGVCLAFPSFVYGLIVAFSVLVKGAVVPGFAALATLISFLFGLLLIMLGIMGEYIWRIFDQLNGAPESVVEMALVD